MSLLASLAACGDDASSPSTGATSTTASTSTVTTSVGAGGAGGSSDAGVGGAAGTGGDGGATSSPRCGDGTVDDGEACDDGNDAGGDGCSPTCVVSGTLLDDRALAGLWDPLSLVGVDAGFVLAANVLRDGASDAVVVRLDDSGEETSRAVVVPGNPPDDDAYALTIAPLAAGDVVVGGVSSADGIGHDFLTRVRADGSSAWVQIGESDNNEIAAVVVADDGTIFAGAYGELWLRAYTTGGALQWTVPPANDGDAAQVLARRAGGGVFVLGSRGDGAGEMGVALTAVDADGRIAWSDTIDEPGAAEFPIGAATAPDGDVFTVISRTYEETVHIRRYADDGELRWDLTSDDLLPSDDFRPKFVTAHPDGGFVVGGSVSGSGVDDAVVAGFDDDANLVWSLVLPGEQVTTVAHDALVAGDGTLVVIGTVHAAPQSDGILWRIAQ